MGDAESCDAAGGVSRFGLALFAFLCDHAPSRVGGGRPRRATSRPGTERVPPRAFGPARARVRASQSHPSFRPPEPTLRAADALRGPVRHVCHIPCARCYAPPLGRRRRAPSSRAKPFLQLIRLNSPLGTAPQALMEPYPSPSRIRPNSQAPMEPVTLVSPLSVASALALAMGGATPAGLK